MIATMLAPFLQEASGGVALDEATAQVNRWAQFGKDLALRHGPGLLTGLVVLVVGLWVKGLVIRILRKILQKRRIETTLSNFLCNISGMVLTVLVIISAAQQMGLETTSFVAVLGAATFAVGLALQGSLANFAAGVLLILFKPFKAGDFVEAGGVSGIVEEINVFATYIRTGDNKQVIVPNADISGGSITNYSAKPTRRVDMVFGIGYDDDIKKAKEILERIVREDERVLDDPAPVVAVLELGESSVNLVCRPWVNTADYWPVFFAFQERVKLEFDANGVSIPFPQRDVHLFQAAAS